MATPLGGEAARRRIVWPSLFLNCAVSVLGSSVLLALFWTTIADPDIWGHVRFGLDLLDSGQVIRPDVYSYVTGEQLWYNHEWLSEAVFALVYRSAGPTGLFGLKLLVALATSAIVYWGLRRARLAPLRAWVIVILSALLLIGGLSTVRPQMFTYLLFAALIFALVEAEEGRSKWLIALPLLFAAWVNLHGGFLAGIAIVLLWALISLARSTVAWARSGAVRGRTPWLAPVTLVACLLATLANPYGVDLWRFLLKTATVPRPEVSEWQPLLLASLRGVFYLILLAVGVMAIATSRKPRNAFRSAALVILALAPLIALRHAQLFAIGLPLLVAVDLTAASSRLPERTGPDGPPWRFVVLLSATVLVTAAVVMGGVWKAGPCIETDQESYPTAAVGALKQSGVTGNVAVHFNWGEYVIWQAGPLLKVSIDGRRETTYTEAVYRKNLAFINGNGAWRALLDEYRADIALVPAGGPAANLLRLSPDWSLWYEDAVAAAFVNSASPLAPVLRSTVPQPPAAVPRLCFK